MIMICIYFITPVSALRVKHRYTYHYIYYKTKSPTASVCLFAINLRNTGGISIQFSTTEREIPVEGVSLSIISFGFVQTDNISNQNTHAKSGC